MTKIEQIKQLYEENLGTFDGDEDGFEEVSTGNGWSDGKYQRTFKVIQDLSDLSYYRLDISRYGNYHDGYDYDLAAVYKVKPKTVEEIVWEPVE